MWPDLSAYAVNLVRERAADDKVVLAVTGDAEAVSQIQGAISQLGFDAGARRPEEGFRWHRLMRILPQTLMAADDPPAPVSTDASTTAATPVESAPQRSAGKAHGATAAATAGRVAPESEDDSAPPPRASKKRARRSGDSGPQIDDFGERIDGARKHLAELTKGGQALAPEAIADWTPEERLELATRDRLWPRLDYQAKLDEGVPKEVLYSIDKIRSLFRREMKQRRYSGGPHEPVTDPRLQMAWARSVHALGQALNAATTMKAVREALVQQGVLDIEYNASGEMYSIGTRSRLTDDEHPISYGFSDFATNRRRFLNNVMEHADVDLYQRIRTRRDAKIEQWTIPQVKRKRRKRTAGSTPKDRLVDLKRTGGQDWRQGRDVTVDTFQTTFGLRGGQWGNWERSTDERQAVLNHAYDALRDLAVILDVPPKALGLDGNLALAFGARGRGGRAAAHYEPGQRVINLTRTAGVGSLAHEWFHAFDHYLAYSEVARPEGNLSAGTDRVQLASEQYGISMRHGRRTSSTLRWRRRSIGLRSRLLPDQDNWQKGVPADWFNELVHDVHMRHMSKGEALRGIERNRAYRLSTIASHVVTDAEAMVKTWAASLPDAEQTHEAARQHGQVAQDLLDHVETLDPQARAVREAFLAACPTAMVAIEAMRDVVLHDPDDLDGFADALDRAQEGFDAFWDIDAPSPTTGVIRHRTEGYYGVYAVRTREEKESLVALETDSDAANDTPADAISAGRGYIVTDYFSDAKEKGSYWKRPHELLARAFETYVYDRLQDQGISSPYLVSPVPQMQQPGFPPAFQWFDYGRHIDRPSSVYPQLGDRVWLNHRFDGLFKSLEYKHTDSGVALYSLRDKPVDGAGGMSAEQVGAIIDEWALNKAVRVIIVDDPERLPGPCRPHARALARPERNEIWMAASNLSSRLEVEQAFMEEAVHVGLRAVMGERLDPVLREIASQNTAVQAKADELRASYAALGVELDECQAIEESIGHLAAEGGARKIRGFGRLVAAVKAWMRDSGLGRLAGKWTDNDVGLLIEQAATSVFARPGPTQHRVSEKHYESGAVWSREYTTGGVRDRNPAEGPAYESYAPDGTVSMREYRVAGRLHRDPDAGPAREWFDRKGNVERREYFEHGQYVEHPDEVRPDNALAAAPAAAPARASGGLRM